MTLVVEVLLDCVLLAMATDIWRTLKAQLHEHAKPFSAEGERDGKTFLGSEL